MDHFNKMKPLMNDQKLFAYCCVFVRKTCNSIPSFFDTTQLLQNNCLP